MKSFLLGAALMLLGAGASAQFNYTFTTDTATYMPLTNGTSVNDTLAWDDEYYTVPVGFSFDMDSITINTLSFVSGNMFATDTAGVVNAFVMMPADVMDRGYMSDTVSHSPIRYQVTGTTPNRIFKMEVFNAGFYDEYDLYNTTNDSINYQIWLYETSNIVELHYGNSSITHQSDYFDNDSAEVSIGYLKQANVDLPLMEMFYYLNGDPATPTIDSTNNILALMENGISAIPVSGTVYRFTPPTLSVRNALASLKAVEVYPTVVEHSIYIDNRSSQVVNYSVVGINGAVNVKGTATPGKSTVDISNLPSGVYTIMVSNDNVGKVVKFTRI